MENKNQMIAIAGGILIASAVKAAVTVTTGAIATAYAQYKLKKALKEASE